MGGAYRLTLQGGTEVAAIEGTYQEAEPPTRLVFTWRWNRPEPPRHRGAAVEDVVLDLVDVVLQAGDDGPVVIDDAIEYRVHDRQRSALQQVPTRLQVVADAREIGRFAVANGDHDDHAANRILQR